MAKTKKSSLRDRMKKSGIREQTRHAEAEPPGGGSLPPGISGGVARLTKLDFNEIENGDYAGNQRFYFHGVCVSPAIFESDNGKVRTKGLLVQSRQVIFADTKDWQGNDVPFDENYKKAENLMKLIGIPTEEFDDDTFEEEVLAYVEENPIHFRFRTWKADDSDRVNTVIEGAVDDFDEEGDDDSSEDPEDTNEEETTDEPDENDADDSDDDSSGDDDDNSEDDVTTDEPVAQDDDVDWKALGKKADGGDSAVQDRIADWSEANGVDCEDEQYDDWSAVVAAVLAKTEGGEEASDDEESGEEEEAPAEVVLTREDVGNVYGYRPPRAKKDVEVEVTRVLMKSKKANVKRVDGKGDYKAVPWADLKVL